MAFPRLMAFLIGGMIVVAGAGLLLYRGTTGNLEHEVLLKELKEAREEGLVFNIALLKPAPVPPDQNAATVYRQIASEVVARRKAGNWPSVDEEMEFRESSENRAAIKAAIQKNGDLFEMVKAATEMQVCRFDYAYTPDEDIGVEEMAAIKAALRLMFVNVELLAEEGRMEESLGELRLISKAISQLFQEPVLILKLMQVAYENIWNQSVLQVLYHCGPSSTNVRAVKQLLDDSDKAIDFSGTIYTEAAIGYNLMFERDETRIAKPPLWKRWFHPSEDALKVSLVRFYRGVLAAYPAHLDRPLIARARLQVLSSEMELGPLSEEAFYSWDMIIEVQLSGRARRWATYAVLDILDYIDVNGSFPESLEHAGGHKDPFTDTLLRVAGDKEAFVVYSVGPNLRDDGGRTIGEEQRDDVAVRWPPYPWSK